MQAFNNKHSASIGGGARKNYQELSFNPNGATPSNAFGTHSVGIGSRSKHGQLNPYQTDATKLPATVRSKGTAGFGSYEKDHASPTPEGLLSDRSGRTAPDETEDADFEDYKMREIELNDLNSLISSKNDEVNHGSKKQAGQDEEGTRDVLLLRCRDAIEELHAEIEDERNQKLAIAQELQELQQFTAELKMSEQALNEANQ